MAFNESQNRVIQDAKKAWADSYAKGDKAGMQAAHAAAEKERAKYGYSGGSDGSQRINTYSTSSPSATAAKNGSKAVVSNKKKSTVNTNTTASPANSNNTAKKNPNIVNTNSSWKGNYLDVDLNKDYRALQKEAEARGDLVQAANYEALRNAKIGWLDSMGQNKDRWGITNEYVKETATNNRGGISFDPTNTASNDGASTFYNNGTAYRRDGNGNIYGVSGRQSNGIVNEYLVGDGYNADTGEFTYSNAEDAKNAYVQQMIGTGVLPVGSTYDDAAALGLADPGYVGAIMNGDYDEYTKYLQRTGRTNYVSPVVYDEDEEEIEIPAEAVNDNSFENDLYNNDYWNSVVMGWNRLV